MSEPADLHPDLLTWDELTYEDAAILDAYESGEDRW